MDELVNPMEKMTKNLPSLILEHYVLKKDGYNHYFSHRDFDVIKNKFILGNGVNILFCTLLKPVLKYCPYYVDSFEKKVGANI